MKFNVFNGEYPFDIHLGEVTAENPEDALQAALTQFRTVDHPHPVVQPADADTQTSDGHRTYH